MNITINIPGIEALTAAINNLAQSFGGNAPAAPQQPQAPVQPAQQPTAPVTPAQAPQAPITPPAPAYLEQPTTPIAPAAPQAPVAPPAAPIAPVAPPAQAPQAPITPPVQQIPTTAVPQAYTQDQIAVAMTGLVDQGRQADVMQVLAQFGAPSLVQIPKESYPALVVQLRGLGANI